MWRFSFGRGILFAKFVQSKIWEDSSSTLLKCLWVQNINMNCTVSQLKPRKVVPAARWNCKNTYGNLNVSNDLNFHHMHISFHSNQQVELNGSKVGGGYWFLRRATTKHPTRHKEEEQSGHYCPMPLLLALYCPTGFRIIMSKIRAIASPSHIQGGGNFHDIFFSNKCSIHLRDCIFLTV